MRQHFGRIHMKQCVSMQAGTSGRGGTAGSTGGVTRVLYTLD
jgi:uncharacterized membrane protein YtjA (UPF0391 family)